MHLELAQLKISERKIDRESERLNQKLDIEERTRIGLERELQLLKESEREWQHKYALLEQQAEKLKRDKDDLNRQLRELSFKLSFRS